MRSSDSSDTAIFSGQIDKAKGTRSGDGLSFYFVWAVRDNGKAKDAAPDMITTRRSATPVDCKASTLAPVRSLTHGKVTLHMSHL